MNVVGKVGSLITQGVYSVATPFHPFGGAVDIIVVQQQDGSFRSTPWYVRFGKFQGVLKGAEKVVRINVNGVEANFHMYLDNSGEAYFIHEGESRKGIVANAVVVKDSGDSDIGDKNLGEICRLEHSVSDSGVAQLREECESSCTGRLERAESTGDRRYYDFQDEQSSLDGSIELSEFESNRFENLDGDHIGESKGSDSEVILVSVDGHILTAPVSASEENTKNVQLDTPQFHLGPGEGTEEFNSGDDAWAADYINKLGASASNAACDDACSENQKEDDRVQVCEEDSCFEHELKVCEGDGDNVCHIEETQDIDRLGEGLQSQSDLENASARIRRDEVFKSCLELPKLVERAGVDDFDEIGSSPEFQRSNDGTVYSAPEVDQTENEVLVQCMDNGVSSCCSPSSAGHPELPALHVVDEAIETNSEGEEHLTLPNVSVHSSSIGNDPEHQDEEFHPSIAGEELDANLQIPMSKDNCRDSTAEPEIGASGIEIQTCSRFEISLCGKELRVGMGFDAADKVFEAHRVSVEEFKSSATSIIKNENLIIRFGERYYPWEKAAPIVLGVAAFGIDLPIEPADAIPVEQGDLSEQRDDDAVLTPSSSSRRWRLWPIPFRRVKTIEHTGSNASSEDLFVDTESGVHSNVETASPSVGSVGSPKQFVRTNAPTSEQIASLNLRDGQNMITFSFCTRVLGKQQVDAHIYLWKWNARIVISDVDGTITKSDVLGQFMPLVGRDWTQSGVTRLFSAIKENGYQLLFLSARAIVQAYLTRTFLFNVKQDGKTLPNGPVVISPDGLFPSLYREVIRRAPHEFKIACLEDIKRLFPSDYNPFYAGFGNRDTDELSYRRIGIPKGKIFIINPKGEVAMGHRIDVKSYTSLHTLVNDMFPPTSLVEQEDYNQWNFWKVPLPDID